ncbi:hypothetical protein NUW54_g13404 [Trametes sanguinea]|uniref:Uncharacterized protein n=1 Tax=Trametes sanguinea TaxID=158606 RepID=A0ACC1MNE6_9APHY|nr:hypothetical protein NUW54_g13404 [Trametes sanguinea]
MRERLYHMEEAGKLAVTVQGVKEVSVSGIQSLVPKDSTSSASSRRLPLRPEVSANYRHGFVKREFQLVLDAVRTLSNYVFSYVPVPVHAAILAPTGRFGKFLLVMLSLTAPSACAPTMYTVCMSFMTIHRAFARVPRFVIALVSTAVLIPLAIIGAGKFYTTFVDILGKSLTLHAAVSQRLTPRDADSAPSPHRILARALLLVPVSYYDRKAAHDAVFSRATFRMPISFFVLFALLSLPFRSLVPPSARSHILDVPRTTPLSLALTRARRTEGLYCATYSPCRLVAPIGYEPCVKAVTSKTVSRKQNSPSSRARHSYTLASALILPRSLTHPPRHVHDIVAVAFGLHRRS